MMFERMTKEEKAEMTETIDGLIKTMQSAKGKIYPATGEGYCRVDLYGDEPEVIERALICLKVNIDKYTQVFQ